MALRAARDLYQYRGHVIESAPGAEPVTASDLRAFMRETATGLPDSEAEAFIEEARQLIEQATGIALITQSWRLVLDTWPSGGREPWWDGVIQGAISELHRGDGDVVLPRYPLKSVTSVTVYDEASNSSSVTVSDTFDVDTYRTPGRIALKSGQTWPIALRPTNGVEIIYVAGYGNAASNVPAALRRAVKQAAAYLYTHRGDECCSVEAVASVSGILDQYRVARL